MFLKVSQEDAGARVFFNKVAGLKSYNFIKSRLQHRCFPVNFCKFLRKTHPANNSSVWQNPNDPDDEKKHFKQPHIAIERLYFVKPSEELQKEWKNRIDKLDRRYRDLLLQEHCNKLSNLMGNFWCCISYAEVDALWLLKVKTNLDKLDKIQSKIKWKELRKISTNFLLNKMVLEGFDEHLSFFKFKFDFNAFCYSEFSDFK